MLSAWFRGYVRRLSAAAFACGLFAWHPAASQEVAMFKAGISDPVNTVLAWYVARDAGFYAANGLNVEILNMSGGSRGAAELQAGRLDTMHVGLSSVIKVNRAGGDGSGKAVHGAVVGAKDHASAPFGDDQFGRVLRPFFPELQAAPETLFPFRVQIEQQVDAPVESQPFIIMRVRMGHKHALRRTAMESAALIVRIGDQSGDPADRLQESEKRRRGELIEHG